jgi:hypothetical protein
LPFSIKKQLEDCIKEFYSLTINNDVYVSPRNKRPSFSSSNLPNEGNLTSRENNISFFQYFQIYDLLSKKNNKFFI